MYDLNGYKNGFWVELSQNFSEYILMLDFRDF